MMPHAVKALREEGRALLVARSGAFDDDLTFWLVCRWREAYAMMNGTPLYMEKERGELGVTLVWLTTKEPACWAVKEPEGRDALPYLQDRRADWEALHRVLAARKQQASAIYREYAALRPSYGCRTAQYHNDFKFALAQPERAMYAARDVLWFFEDRHGLERGWEPWPMTPKTQEPKP